MCNCGSRSQRMQSHHANGTASVEATHGSGRGTTVEFVYIGRTAVTTIGPVSGETYRFHRSGARVHVDERDAASVAQVPVLRRV